MKNKILYILWGALYILAVVLGGIQDRNTAGHILLGILSLAFFVPPFWLVIRAVIREEKATLRLIRWIGVGSLALTVIFMVVNIFSVWAESTLFGDVMYALLVVVSAPWACSYYGAVSLFLWACLVMLSIPRLWKPNSK